MVRSNAARLLVAAFTSCLSGCGLAVPDMRVATEDPAESQLEVNRITNRIQCELAKSISTVLYEYSGKDRRALDWFHDWTAKVTLRLTVYEKSGLSPSILFANNPGVPKFNFGFGGNLSTSATRTETLDFFWIVRDLTNRNWPEQCDNGPGFPIVGDFKFYSWLKNALIITRTPDTISRPFTSGGPLDSIQNQIEFVIDGGAGFSPSWNLNLIDVNAGTPLISFNKTKTNFLLITMGPLSELKSGRPQAALAATNLHNAALFGQSVSSNLINR